MLSQNDKNLRGEINLWGCNFLSHLYLVRQDWSADEIEKIYLNAVRRGIMTKKCKVDDPSGLLALARSSLRQRGGVDLTTGKTWGVLRNDPSIKGVIARWTKLGSSGWHFTVLDLDGNEIYDPYDSEQASYDLKKNIIVNAQFYC